MNAGGIAKTCKLSEAVAILTERRKGEEYISMYPKVEDSQEKSWVILDVVVRSKVYRLGSGECPIR